MACPKEPKLSRSCRSHAGLGDCFGRVGQVQKGTSMRGGGEAQKDQVSHAKMLVPYPDHSDKHTFSKMIS